jgi:thymidylate synthase
LVSLAQWRFWGQRADHPGIDQISELINGIKEKPNSRRHIVSAWNPTDIPSMALPPCHCFFQIYVTRNMTLDMQIYQRSADIFLGVPFNIASYALLLMMISHVTGYKAGRLLHVLGDVHLYSNHEDQALQQLQRVTLYPRKTPVVKLNPDIEDIFDFGFKDIVLEAYKPHNSINEPVKE